VCAEYLEIDNVVVTPAVAGAETVRKNWQNCGPSTSLRFGPDDKVNDGGNTWATAAP
jgi:hypothetical protein